MGSSPVFAITTRLTSASPPIVARRVVLLGGAAQLAHDRDLLLLRFLQGQELADVEGRVRVDRPDRQVLRDYGFAQRAMFVEARDLSAWGGVRSLLTAAAEPEAERENQNQCTAPHHHLHGVTSVLERAGPPV